MEDSTFEKFCAEKEKEMESEEGLSVCEQIFQELVESWLDAHGFELFAKTQENLLQKSNKRQKK